MTVTVILAHPRPGSFNHALAQAAIQALSANAHEVRFHDLYAERFDPLLTASELDRNPPLPRFLQSHCQEISGATGLVIVHPNWWGQPPAILKGWLDRVFRPGVAYEFLEGDSGEGVPRGLLKARTVLVFTTSNTPRERELSVFGDPLETLWKNCVFGLCGVPVFFRRNFEVVVTSTPAERRQWLAQAADLVQRYFPAKDS